MSTKPDFKKMMYQMLKFKAEIDSADGLRYVGQIRNATRFDVAEDFDEIISFMRGIVDAAENYERILEDRLREAQRQDDLARRLQESMDAELAARGL